jgi:uncharacterized protein (DUF58 family)
VSILNKIETFPQNTNRVYIVPSKDGLKFVFINFFLFLIAIAYTNNMALLITFIMVTFFILQMFSTHRIINSIELDNLETENQFLNIQHATQLRFKEEVPTEYSPHIMAALLQSSGKRSDIEGTFSNHLSEKTISFNFNFLRRGHYRFKRLKLYTFGPSKLFYVWRYFTLENEVFIYPKKTFVDKSSKVENESSQNYASEQEFSHHIRYTPGMPSKRIDWKVYARSDNLFWKKHSDKQSRVFEINYSNFKGSKEAILEKMSYLIDHHFHQGDEFKVLLPNQVLPSSSGNSHYQSSMEAISVF